MRIFHPQTTLHGAERDNSFIVQDNAGVELGRGWLMVANRAQAPERPLQIRMQMDAHPAARDMLYGALIARSKFLGRQLRASPACLVANCDLNDADMRGFYALAGFDDADGEELFHWDLIGERRAFYAPVGTSIVPTFLQTYADMEGLLMRVNHWQDSGQQHEVEWLMEAAELPYFVVCGVYSGGECIGEAMATGADGEAALEMLYTLPAWRRRHVATALMFHIKAQLAQRGATTLRVQAQRSNLPAMCLLQKLKFRWINTLRVYPTLYL
jgi:ribosomal protein S18 acetylase RimI-like enzyme